MTGVSPAHLTGIGMGSVTSRLPYLIRAVNTHKSPCDIFRTERMVYDSVRGGASLPTTVNWPVSTALVSVDSNCLNNRACRASGVSGLAFGSSALALAKPAISTATLKHSRIRFARMRRLSARPSANASRKERDVLLVASRYSSATLWPSRQRFW